MMSDSPLRGSSQARRAEDTRMHTRMQLDMMGWPCSQWQKILGKSIKRRTIWREKNWDKKSKDQMETPECVVLREDEEGSAGRNWFNLSG